MVEPLEETRNELIFATEPVLSSLDLSIPGSGRQASLVELDEVEVNYQFLWNYQESYSRSWSQIQKGILQICKGLSFLHSSAQLIHSNICPESVVINGAVSIYQCIECLRPTQLFLLTGRLESFGIGLDDTFTCIKWGSNAVGVSYLWRSCAFLHTEIIRLHG